MLQDKEKVKKRWTEYCSSLYSVSGNSDAVIVELEQIIPPPKEDALHDILNVEIEAAVKRLKKKNPRHRHHRGNDTWLVERR